jgi:membrane protease YdiL (CAAX protease family)
MDVEKEVTSITTQRSEWAVLLFAIVLPTIVTYAYFVAFANAPPQIQYSVYSLGKCLQFALPVLWVFGKLRHRFSIQELWPDFKSGGWGLGVLMGVASFVAMLALFHFVLSGQAWFTASIDEVRAKVIAIGCDRKMPFLAMACFYSVVHSFLEEYYWRWFVYGRLRNLMPTFSANIVSSLGFMAHHVLVLGKYFGGISGPTIFFSLCVAVGGAFWAWLYQRSGSLWPSWMGHAIVDAAIFAIGYQMVFSA